MFKKNLILVLICFLFFIACNQQNSTVKDEKPKNEKVQIGEFGKQTTIKEKLNVNEEKISGPFKVILTDVFIDEIEPSEKVKNEFYNGKNKATLVYLKFKIENTTQDTNTLFATQGTLVTNTKEQKEADLSLSDDINAVYQGNVIQTGCAVIQVDSKPEEINYLKYNMGKPFNSKADGIGEEIIFEINI